jgi:hypothetical protein
LHGSTGRMPKMVALLFRKISWNCVELAHRDFVGNILRMDRHSSGLLLHNNQGGPHFPNS